MLPRASSSATTNFAAMRSHPSTKVLNIPGAFSLRQLQWLKNILVDDQTIGPNLRLIKMHRQVTFRIKN